MLIDFLYELRRAKLSVSTHEWLALMEGLALGLHESSLDGFYRLARAICVKDVTEYDSFDEAFLRYFKDAHQDALELTRELLRWLENPAEQRVLTAEEKALLEAMDLEQLRALFEQRLREQKERHDRGNRWVGTGGSSPFGNGGVFPGGLRVGGMGGGRSAMQVAGERRFRAYRKDVVLDVRQIDIALRDLRQLGREGAPDELDLDETVDETCRNAGELELVFRAPRRNRVKLILMMDVGGTMDPHTQLVSRLFTAASRAGRFASFRSYYFHNCIYEKVYERAQFRDGIPVADLIAKSDRDERLIIVGDAWMHPAELLQPGGSVFYSHHNRTSGLDWLKRLRDHFRRTAWLNPEPKRFWRGSTIEMIAEVMPMWPLTINGIEGAVRYLVRGGRTPVIDDE